MIHRIRTAAIIIQEEKILLVKHVHPETKFEWWVPPGGGLEEKDNSVIDGVKREVWEETGCDVEVENDPLFIREYFHKKSNTLNLELFFRARITSGEITLDNIHGNGEDELYIKDVKWLSLEELQDIVVYPQRLKDNFARDVEDVYLGRQID